MEHTQDKGHPKQEFQVERMAFFSDAVFAIAITLLIIEFHVPKVTAESTYHTVMHDLEHMGIELVALLVSYVMISVYWIRHHFLYKYIHNYNKQTIAANMLALLPIIFLPFSTAFLGECAKNGETAIIGFRLFFINHFLGGTTVFLLYWLSVVKHKNLAYAIPVAEKVHFYEQTLFTSFMFVALFIATFFTASLNSILYVMVVCVLLRVVAKKILKRRLSKSTIVNKS